MGLETLAQTTETEIKKIAIIGLPNTGKSLIFSHLTGKYTIVANYPLTTVEPMSKECCIHGGSCQVIDTPGLHCLQAHSEEELAVRNLVLHESPDLILQCIDASRLKQSLTLTAELLEVGVPMVVCLNAIDESARKGIWIDSPALSQSLGVPVVETIATQGQGIAELKRALDNAATPPVPLRYGEAIENAVSDIIDLFNHEIAHPRKTALLFCSSDPFIEQLVAELPGAPDVETLKERVEKLKLQLRGDVTTAMAKAISKWANEAAEAVTKQHKVSPALFSNTFGHMCRHPVFGIPIAAFFLILTYYLEVHVAGALEGFLDTFLATPIVNLVARALPEGFWHDLIIGQDYGLLTLGLFNAICTVLPILSVFFLMFGALEDMGYIPNLCVLTKRLFAKVGLSGKAVMSLVLGFGCKTMATLTTLGLPRKEKLIAVYLIAFSIPCSAQMGLSMGLLGRYALWALMLAFGALAIVEIIAGMVLKRLITDDERSDFIQELPTMRLPSPKAVVIKTYYRLYWFLKEAVPVFMIAALGLFVVDRIGLLDAIKVAFEPLIVNWLGMPIDVVDALILCLARHEAATALLIDMADAGKLDIVQCIVAVFLTTMFVPCFANIVSMCKMVGTKVGVLMAVAINLSAFVFAGVLYWLLVFFREILT